jgi:hypothetical protein
MPFPFCASDAPHHPAHDCEKNRISKPDADHPAGDCVVLPVQRPLYFEVVISTGIADQDAFLNFQTNCLLCLSQQRNDKIDLKHKRRKLGTPANPVSPLCRIQGGLTVRKRTGHVIGHRIELLLKETLENFL